ncbi:MAG: ABC transporter permease, partial [Planctomycetota bacterium]
SIDDWDPPFPFEQSRIKPADDDYWAFHRTTPKAFISLADGQRLWASRFGKATSVRIPSDAVNAVELESRLTAALAKRNDELGFAFRPVKATSLLASKGTTPFEFLFIGFSFFLIASALMLVAILFRLTVELRASSLGTILASGWNTSALRRATVTELAIVATVGAAIGVLGGVLYAAIMLAGLRNLWVAAIVTPFLQLHVGPTSLVIGFVVTATIAILVVWFSLRRLGDSTILDLLAGKLTVNDATGKKSFRGWLPPALAIVAVILALVAIGLSGEAQAGAFFGSGSMILTAGLLMIRATLHRQGTTAASQDRISPLSLAWRSATRNPGRSTLTIGLMAAATFLIIAIAAFRLAPTESGTGGFQLLADSDRPIFVDFRDNEQIEDAFGNQSLPIEASTILPMRVHQGDDASCRNLYQATRPTLLGVTPAMLEFFESNDSQSAWSNANWSEMKMATPADEPVPVILDKNTAMYSLHLPPSIGHEFTLDFDPPIRFRIAGLLSNTTMQGSLIVPEPDLLRLFPDTSGFQKFLIKSNEPSKVSDLLEERFGDEGLDVVRSADILSGLLAVQNTYLSTFQSLGALGLLLGTLGLAAVQVRNILTRRGELALLSAIGYSQSAVRRQLIWENATLLLAGLGIGTIAALVVVVPHAIFGNASLPLSTIAITLTGILVLGLLAGIVTSRFALNTPILAALREE